MKRLLPLRDYDEHDVINQFSADAVNNSSTDSGDGDAGVIVYISNGNLDDGPTAHVTSTYLGKTDYPYVGQNKFAVNPLKVSVAGSGDAALGITLRETALYDENGEKYLYNLEKADANQIVITGQSVPVLTRGFVSLDQSAFVANSIPAIGSNLVVGEASGKFDVQGTVDAGDVVVGKVLATGSRVAGKTADLYAGAAGATGLYAQVQVTF